MNKQEIKNWNKLKDYKCPICGYTLNPLYINYYYCSNNIGGCEFKISKDKFDTLVSKMYKKELWPKN